MFPFSPIPSRPQSSRGPNLDLTPLPRDKVLLEGQPAVMANAAWLAKAKAKGKAKAKAKGKA